MTIKRRAAVTSNYVGPSVRVLKTNEALHALVWYATRWPSRTLQGKLAAVQKTQRKRLHPVQCYKKMTSNNTSTAMCIHFRSSIYWVFKKLLLFHRSVFWCGFWNKRVITIQQNKTFFKLPFITLMSTTFISFI